MLVVKVQVFTLTPPTNNDTDSVPATPRMRTTIFLVADPELEDELLLDEELLEELLDEELLEELLEEELWLEEELQPQFPSMLDNSQSPIVISKFLL